jgi:hypothetical protein
MKHVLGIAGTIGNAAATATAILVCTALAVPAATPPATMNYQGVLRNATDKPLTGTYDMTFRFFDALTGGNEILVDTHAAAGSGAVTVTGGLFNALLGGGTITDGSGAGAYTSLADVFRDYAAVWVEIKVGTETLTPRVKVQASAYAQNAASLAGRTASGYLDTSATAQTKAGGITVTAAANGIDATGSSRGGWFKNSGNTSSAELATNGGWGAYVSGSFLGGEFKNTANDDLQCAYNGYGAIGYGHTSGGYFSNLSSFSVAQIADANYAIEGTGSRGGAFLVDVSATASAKIAETGYGVYAFGNTAGGYFQDSQDGSFASAGSNGYGISAHGTTSGGYFSDGPVAGYSYLGYNGYGIEGYGANAGGYFKDTGDTSEAYIASNGYGVYASAAYSETGAGGYFVNGGGTAYVALGTDPLSPYGGPFSIDAVMNTSFDYTSWPGNFVNSSNGLFTRLAFNDNFTASSIWGNGTKNFVQNHPYDATKSVTYACLEGDEVGTYTRGTARLVSGEARIALGDTFPWVTNPDVGLTAQLTPRGSAALLYVVSLSASELVVRGASGDPSAAFDYVVHGLRVGFEDAAVVTDRTAEAKLPGVSSMEKKLQKRPDLERYTPLSRFREMATTASLGGASGDMTRGLALRAAIGEFDAARDAGTLAGVAAPSRAPAPPKATASGAVAPPGVAVGGTLTAGPAPTAGTTVPAAPVALGEPRSRENQVEVAEPVTAGDVLALDPTGADALRLGREPADPGVVGIVTGEAGATLRGTAPIALGGTIVLCHVDASYGAIAPGDLLVTSATAGYAMRAGEGPHEGRVLAKALQPWTAGTGSIRVLVMAR